MIRSFYLRMMLPLLLIWGGPSNQANAQFFRPSMARSLGKGDITAVQPVVRDILEHGQVGERRPWQSRSGGHGQVILEEGGARAGTATGRVRISLIGRDRRAQAFVFRYQRDAHGVWRTIG